MSGGLKKMREHVNAVKNIQKITTSMKAVSSSKFARSEKQLRRARPLGEAAKYFYAASRIQVEETAPHTSFVAVSSDRGLCGSMHTKVCGEVLKLCRSFKKINKNFDIVCIGEKAKFILSFDHADNISMVVNGIGHRAPSFLDASRIAARICKGDPYSQGHVVFPLFKNMVEFKISSLWLYSMAFILSTKGILSYEFDDQDFPSYIEFSQVALLYFALCDTYLVELAQRISAMSNASKNAKEMTDKLTLEANRKRQQMVTTEICDIVSGASVISSK